MRAKRSGNPRGGLLIGVNPHYGGSERRIEAFLLDFEGDLYGSRLRLELWERLRDERAFESEGDLVAQIAADVDAAPRRPPAGLRLHEHGRKILPARASVTGVRVPRPPALSVRCLGCGQVYVKPIDGAAPAGAHACPGCGYVGWIPAEQGLMRDPEPFRYASDPLHHQTWR